MKEGSIVYCIYHGIGRIIDVNTNSTYPYKVQFDNGKQGAYTKDGKIVQGGVNICLFTQIKENL